MIGKEVYKKWAPVGARWVDWVRPVPFVGIDDELDLYEACNFENDINYISEYQEDTAIIIDLPGVESVIEGIDLAKIGYRPIPLYNGTNEQKGAIPTTQNNTIEKALIWGASELEKINISDIASPVFLLDSNRTNRFKMNPSVFDNSWDIYDQDMPSADYLKKNGIEKVIVIGKAIQKDLKVILYKYQKKGINIYFTKKYDEARKVNIKKFFNIYI